MTSEERKYVLSVLRDLEWLDGVDEAHPGSCPSCYGSKPAAGDEAFSGHLADCELSLAIKIVEADNGDGPDTLDDVD